MMKIDIQDVDKFLAWKKMVNECELKDLILVKNGKEIEQNAQSIHIFQFTGLSNLDYINMFYVK